MQNDRKLRRKVRTSYLISTVSIALVLFLLGSVAYLIIGALNATDRMKESIAVYIMLKDDLTREQADGVKGKLLAIDGVKEAMFVSREDAAAEFREYSGDDFMEFLDFNPLPDSYEVRMLASGDDLAGVMELENKVTLWPEVEEVVYQKNVVEQISSNINKFNLVLLLFGVSLLIISLILLNNTIRVTIFSKRYVINTMKLVGATKGFIMKPFLLNSILQGVYAAIIAAVMFAGMVAGMNEGLPEVRFVSDNMQLLFIVGGMFLLGVLISLIFTSFAVSKFIRMRTNAVHLY